MICRFFEKHVEVERNECSQKAEDMMKLDYYLLESDSEDDDIRGEQKVYGVEIVKKQDGSTDEQSQFRNIYANREKVKNLIRLLAEHTVTPSSLPDILDDLIGT